MELWKQLKNRKITDNPLLFYRGKIQIPKSWFLNSLWLYIFSIQSGYSEESGAYCNLDEGYYLDEEISLLAPSKIFDIKKFPLFQTLL